MKLKKETFFNGVNSEEDQTKSREYHPGLQSVWSPRLWFGLEVYKTQWFQTSIESIDN
jgi:hypothetical protein